MTWIIGTREFTDGICRDVYQDDDGRQWVLEGEPVYGIWMLPTDEPIAVEPPSYN